MAIETYATVRMQSDFKGHNYKAAVMAIETIRAAEIAGIATVSQLQSRCDGD